MLETRQTSENAATITGKRSIAAGRFELTHLSGQQLKSAEIVVERLRAGLLDLVQLVVIGLGYLPGSEILSRFKIARWRLPAP